MADQWRIPADADYISLVGRAIYNFASLEWVIVWMTVRLGNDGFDSMPKGREANAGNFAQELRARIKAANPELSAPLKKSILKVCASFDRAIPERNKLLHAHPITAVNGAQILRYNSTREWAPEEVREVAQQFERLQIEANNLYWNQLKAERPWST